MKIIGITLMLMTAIAIEATVVNLLTGLSLKASLLKTPETITLMSTAEKLIFTLYPLSILFMPLYTYIQKKRKTKETTKS